MSAKGATSAAGKAAEMPTLTKATKKRPVTVRRTVLTSCSRITRVSVSSSLGPSSCLYSHPNFVETEFSEVRYELAWPSNGKKIRPLSRCACLRATCSFRETLTLRSTGPTSVSVEGAKRLPSGIILTSLWPVWTGAQRPWWAMLFEGY